MQDAREEYQKLLRTTYFLGVTLLIVLLLGIFGFYKGWFGEPGKIYFSPDTENSYVKCGAADFVGCPSGTQCQEVRITPELGEEINDEICL